MFAVWHFGGLFCELWGSYGLLGPGVGWSRLSVVEIRKKGGSL
jgi:hypothetical protein